MNYIIRGFDEQFGQLMVECSCANHSHTQTFAVDLPIKEDGTYPVGEELDTLIRSMMPTWHFERLDAVAAGVSNADQILALVVPYPEPVVPVTPEEQTQPE